MEETDFLHAVTNSEKLKVDSMIFGWAQSKMEMTFQFTRLEYVLYLKNEFMK